MAGRFIVLEGLDGSGLHELAGVVFDLIGNRHKVRERWLTREPSDGPIGSIIRLSLAGRLEVAPESLPLFFAADRADHLYKRDGIVSRLERGEYVICDRYYLSSYAYQTSDLMPDTSEFAERLGWLRTINERWCLAPDLTLFVDLPVDTCLRRMLAEQRELGHTQVVRLTEDAESMLEAKERLARVRANYLAAIKVLSADSERAENIRVVGSGDATLTEFEMKRAVERELDKMLKSRKI